MQGGALDYLLKPFSFPILRDKLLSYAQMRARLELRCEGGPTSAPWTGSSARCALPISCPA